MPHAIYQALERVDFAVAERHAHLLALRMSLAKARWQLMYSSLVLVWQLIATRWKIAKAIRPLERHIEHIQQDDGQRFLNKLRSVAVDEAKNREYFADGGGNTHGLSRVIVWLMDDYLAIIEDVIETLELSVDPHVRTSLANAIHDITDSRPPDPNVRTPA